MNVELTTARQPKTVGQVKSGQLLSPRIVELTRDEASSFRVPAGTKDDRKRRGFDRECRWHAARCDNNGDRAADHSSRGNNPCVAMSYAAVGWVVGAAQVHSALYSSANGVG